MRNIILVVFSLVFYAWGEPVWIGLLIFSALVDYLNGLFIERFRNTHWSKIGIVITLIVNIGLLITFKYSDFIIENINTLLGSNFKEPGFMLPIGISFYTFQTISYSIDVYRNEVKAQKSFLNFLMFVSLYHQLVAGPIVRYSHIEKEINNRTFAWNDFSEGVTRFSKGLFKKVCFANVAGEIVVQLLEKNIADISIPGAWLGISMFAIQIYFDFSGYSDMAIGLGKMFGFNYMENFNYPYISSSISDFWRRWHISLGTFFKDYLYIPLGGNRKNTYLNLLIVWFCTGLWHGASWNFILWGMYFCMIIILEKLFLQKILDSTIGAIRHMYSIFFIIIGWAIFYFTDINELAGFLQLLLGVNGNLTIDSELYDLLLKNSIWMFFALLFSVPAFPYLMNMVRNRSVHQAIPNVMIILLNLLMLGTSIALLVNKTYNPFIYFRF